MSEFDPRNQTPDPHPEGVKFLKEKTLSHTDNEVEQSAEREDSGHKPFEKIKGLVKTVDKVMKPDSVGEGTIDRGQRNLALLEEHKEKLYQEYGVVTSIEDLQENKNYWQSQIRIAERQGRSGELPQDEEGNRYIPDDVKEENIKAIQTDQRESFDQWVNYLASQDSNYIPSWALIWALDGVLKSGKYDEENGSFRKRDKKSVNSYPELNQEALGLCVDALVNKVENGEITEDNPELQKAIESTNFRKLYGKYLEQVTQEKEINLEDTQGHWIKYEQESEPDELVDSLRGWNTGWCTASRETAAQQLQGGDFYVYYSVDNEGNEVVPRLAIRMQEDKIAEIRGRDKDQNLDPYISPILDEKLEDFGDEADEYREKQADVDALNLIVDKDQAGEELTKEDIMFLYEVDRDMKGFGYASDARIDELKEKRDQSEDLQTVLHSLPDPYQGDLNLHGFDDNAIKDISFPKIVEGDVKLEHLITLQGVELPETVGGNLELDDLTSLEGVKLPKTVGGALRLPRLTTLEGGELPEIVKGHLHLNNLITLEEGELPEEIGGGLYLSSLTTLKGGELPKKVGGTLRLTRLTTLEGGELPETVGGNLDLSNLVTLEGGELPEEVSGGLDLRNLITLGVELPEKVGGNLDLRKLTTLEEGELPEKVGGSLFLDKLTTLGEGELPKKVGGSLFLDKLTTLGEGELPKKVGGELWVNTLTTLEGVSLHQLPQEVGDKIIVSEDIEYIPREILDKFSDELDLSTKQIQQLYLECERREEEVKKDEEITKIKSDLEKSE